MRPTLKLAVASFCACLFAAPAHAAPVLGIDNVFFYGLAYPGRPHDFTLTLTSGDSTASAHATLEPFMEYRPEGKLDVPIAGEASLDIREGTASLATLKVHSGEAHLSVVSDCKKQVDYHTVFPYFPFRSYIPPETVTYMCDTQAGAVEVRFICRDKSGCWQ